MQISCHLIHGSWSSHVTDDVIVVDAVAYLVCANHMLRLGYDSVREGKDLDSWWCHLDQIFYQFLIGQADVQGEFVGYILSRAERIDYNMCMHEFSLMVWHCSWWKWYDCCNIVSVLYVVIVAPLSLYCVAQAQVVQIFLREDILERTFIGQPSGLPALEAKWRYVL